MKHPIFSGLDKSWLEVLKDEFEKPYLKELLNFVDQERLGSVPIYPKEEHVLNALNYTPYSKVRVVIVGQDPYHGPGQAHGLSFSVPEGIKEPPSLQNIFKELESDLGILKPKNGYLRKWAEQGVLLLNATLTVQEAKPLSHFGRGWELFTTAILSKVYEKNEPVVFILWGKNAVDKCLLAKEQSDKKEVKNHYLIKSSHPSPLSAYRGFFGSRPFSKTNEIFHELSRPLIDWRL